MVIVALLTSKGASVYFVYKTKQDLDGLAKKAYFIRKTMGIELTFDKKDARHFTIKKEALRIADLIGGKVER